VNDDFDLPPGWRVVTTGEIAQVVGGGTPKTTVAGNFTEDVGHPWITPADLTGYTEKYISRGKRNLTDQGLATSSAKYMPAGTVLYSTRAPIGYIAIASNAVTTNQGFRSFVPSPDVESEYLYYGLKLARQEAEHLASGTTFAELSGTNAKKLHLPLAPLDVQRQLVQLLDSATTRNASARQHLTSARTAIEKFRQAVLAAACSGRLTAVWRESNVPTESAEKMVATVQDARRQRLGHRFKPQSTPTIDNELPYGWTWTTVGALVDVSTGATPLRKRADYYGGSIPWVTSGAVNAGLIKEASEYITDLAVRETNAKVFPAGTLLVAMYGEGQTRGRVAELGIAAATNQAVAALVFDDSNEFLRDYLRTFFLENYERIRLLSFGGVQPNLSLGVIRDTVIPLPPIDEQIEIVRRVDQLSELATSLRTRIDTASRRVDRSSQAVLAKAFRGELIADGEV
jgi:type I restriction enzyme S subunit